MSEILVYGLAGILILVLGLAIVSALAKARSGGQAAAQPKPGRGVSLTSGRPGHGSAAETATPLPDLKVRGAIKNEAKKKIGKIISEHPDRTISLIRHWLHGNGHEDMD